MRGAAEFVKENFKYPIMAAEVGVERGRNAAEMAQELNLNKLFLIDDYLPYTDYLGGYCPPEIQAEVYRTMFGNLTPHLDKIVLVTRSSVFASTLFPDEFFDFVYVDGNHDYDPVKQDVGVWWPKVKKGGLLAGHDFDTRNITRQDVAEAVKDFAKENNLELKIFPFEQLQYSDWGIIK
jgi:Methyltransferase domain